MKEYHNHETTKETFAHFPQQRRLSPAEQDEVAKLLHMKANKKLLQEDIMANTGKVVTLKDLHNIGSRGSRSKAKKDDLTALLDDTRKFNNATVKIVVNEEKELKGIYFQKAEWKDTYQSFPELLFVDTTYKLKNFRMPLYVLLIEDGNGESEIVCLWFVCSVDRETLSEMMQIFKTNNDTSGTRCVMTDKDMVEPDVFAQNPPSAKMLICLFPFHVLRSMKREVTCEKMGISSAQRSSVLRILQQITYARRENDYRSKYGLLQLQQTKLKTVIDYYDSNWHEITKEWVDGLTTDWRPSIRR